MIKNSSQAVAFQDVAQLNRDQITRVMRQITTHWDTTTARIMAESNLTAATAEDKGNVFILAPNDGTARAIADAFAADQAVGSYVITGQDAEQESVQSILDGRQSMTVFKDVRTLVETTIDVTLALLKGETPSTTATYNSGAIDVPAIQSPVISIDKNNVRAALIDSGYYSADDAANASSTSRPVGKPVVGIVLPTTDEPRWLQDKTRFENAFKAAGYDAEILFSQGDPTKQKSNVEALITKGIRALIICPQGGGETVLEVRNWSAYDPTLGRNILKQVNINDKKGEIVVVRRSKYLYTLTLEPPKPGAT